MENCFKKLKTKFVPHINDGIHQFEKTFYFILLQNFRPSYKCILYTSLYASVSIQEIAEYCVGCCMK